MFNFITLVLFIFNGFMSSAKELPKRSFKKEMKNEIKNLLNDAVEDSEEEIEIAGTDEEPLTLLESVSDAEKRKNFIQRELAKKYNLKLGNPVNKATKTDEHKRAINFGDVDLQISERPEEVLIKKESPNKKSNSLNIKSKTNKKINSKK